MSRLESLLLRKRARWVWLRRAKSRVKVIRLEGEQPSRRRSFLRSYVTGSLTLPTLPVSNERSGMQGPKARPTDSLSW